MNQNTDQLDLTPPSTPDLVRRLLQECFSPVTPRAIDRFTDSPRVRAMYAAVADAFPDASFTPLWCVADAERVAIGGSVRATHGGTWRGVPATGRTIEVLSIVMLELSDGGIVDMMVVSDSLAMAEQVGAVEPLGPKACQLIDSANTGRTPCGDAQLGMRTPGR